MAYKNHNNALLYGKTYREKLKSLHLCLWCKQQDAFTLNGRSYCAECAEKLAQAKYNKTYRNETTRQNRKEARKALRLRHIENHKCSQCGTSLPENYSFKLCEKCRTKNRLRDKTTTFMRGQNGICWLCNKQPVIENKRLCKTCYDKELQCLSKIKIDNSNHIWRKYATAEANQK